MNDRAVNLGWMHLARRLSVTVVASSLPLAIAACGNVTVGGFQEVAVDVSGNAPDPLPQASAVATPTLSSSSSSTTRPLRNPYPAGEADEAEGEVEIDLRLALVSDVGEVVPLGSGDVRIKLDLQGVDEAEAVNELVPAAHYTALRLTFTHIQVEVEGGLVVNGQEIIGELHVQLEDPELVVTRAVDIEPIEGSRVGLLVDLNTPAWLAAVDPETRTIDASVFADLLDLVVR